jgi:hypothetical protein
VPLAKKILIFFAVCAAIVLLQVLPAFLGDNQFGPIPDDQPRSVSRLYVPPSIRKSPWLEERRQIQLESAAHFSAFCAFSFTDRIEESGISFRHRITDDSGKRYLPIHYDHGCGLAAADIDGDDLPDLYLVNQAGGNELWRNLGKGRFANWTTPELALEDRICVSASFADTDNDGDADLYVTSVRDGNVLFENDGRGGFADIGAGTGIDYEGHSSAAIFFDYDRDGLLDLFLCNVGDYTRDQAVASSTGPLYYPGRENAFSLHLEPERGERSLLFKNLGDNRFAEVSESMGLQDVSWTGDASPVDFNEDGWPDLYVLNMQGHDQYYENDKGRRFVRKSRQLFPRTPWGSMGIQVFDWDNDGLLDLYITDMHSDMSKGVDWGREREKAEVRYTEDFLQSDGLSIFGNAFYRNLGDGRFEEISDRIGAENYWPWGLSTGDLNADGYEDVFITASMNYPFRYGINSVLLNDQGRRFVDSEFALGVEPRRGRRTSAPFFELDCSSADKGHKHCRGQSGIVQVYGALGSRASVILDLDDDGDLDIVTNDFNSEPMVLISDLSERKPVMRYLKVDLVGRRSNRSGLGAIVQVEAGGRTYTQLRDGRSGYLSQSLLPLYFGLDEADSVEHLEVRWPSGTRQTLSRPIPVNQLLLVEEEFATQVVPSHH